NPSLIPNDLIGGQYGPCQTRADVMAPAVLATHRDDAAVAAAHPASHDAFNRHLAWASEAQCGFRHSGEHSLGATCVNHDRLMRGFRRKLSFERRDHASALARASVLL